MADEKIINVDQLAQLARISLSPAEQVLFSGQLEHILAYFKELQAVDVEGIEPISHPFPSVAPLRDDEAAAAWPARLALANAPASRDDHIVVPKVVEDA